MFAQSLVISIELLTQFALRVFKFNRKLSSFYKIINLRLFHCTNIRVKSLFLDFKAIAGGGDNDIGDDNAVR